MLRLAVAALLAATPALAQPPCAPTGLIHDRLQGNYGERNLMQLQAAEGIVIEVWANDTTQSWTILRTSPDSISCVLGVGTGVYWKAVGEAL